MSTKMSKEIKENPQDGGKIVERDEKGRFIDGHTKLGGSEKGKSYSLVAILRRKLAEVIEKDGIESGEKLVDVWLELAKKDFNALKEVVHYTDGMPKQAIDIGPTEGLKELTEFFREMAKVKKDDKGESKSI